MTTKTETHYCCQCRQVIDGESILAREPRGNRAEVCSAECADKMQHPDPLAAYRLADDTLERWAWPGGYPLYYLDREGNVLCPPCASREIDDGQAAIAADVNWEDASLCCEDCGQRIESAYAEDEEGA